MGEKWLMTFITVSEWMKQCYNQSDSDGDRWLSKCQAVLVTNNNTFAVIVSGVIN